MNLTNREGWRNFVYELFYPGILGSMIFDLADPLRGFPLAKAGLFAIGGSFVIDFLHMIVDLKVKEIQNSRPWLDTAIASSFCIAYFFLSRVIPSPDLTEEQLRKIPFACYCSATLFFLVLAYSLIFYYEFGLQVTSIRKGVSLLLPLLVSLTGLIIVFIKICDIGIIEKLPLAILMNTVSLTVIATIVSCIAYGFHVFYVTK